MTIKLAIKIPKVSDFGISMMKHHYRPVSQEYAKVHCIGGKPIYDEADEVNEHSAYYGKPFDVLFFGIMLWRMVARTAPEELNVSKLPPCDPLLKKIIEMCITPNLGTEKSIHHTNIMKKRELTLLKSPLH